MPAERLVEQICSAKGNKGCWQRIEGGVKQVVMRLWCNDRVGRYTNGLLKLDLNGRSNLNGLGHCGVSAFGSDQCDAEAPAAVNFWFTE